MARRPRRLAMGPGVPPVDIQAWEESKSALTGVGVDPRTGRRYGAVGAPQVIAFPPEIYPTRDAQTFGPTGTIVTGAGPVALTTVTGPFVLPINMVAVIREVTLNVNNLLPTSLVSFALRFNEAPVPGYDNLAIAPRAAASVAISYPPESVLVRVPDGATIDIAVTVLDAGSYQVTANYRGWWYPKDTLVGW